MRLAAFIVVFGSACGPSAEDLPRQTCGGDAPVQLVALPEPGVSMNVGLHGPTIIGDRIVATRLELVGQELESRAFAVDECGEHYVQLASTNGFVAGAGDWAFEYRDEEDGLRRLALDGSGPSEPVFHTPIACVIVMGDALVAAATDGTLWFLERPGTPGSEPVELVRDAVVPEFDHGGPDLTDCWAADGNLPVRDGDALLVAFRDGPLARVSVPSGEREVLVEGPVGEFVVLEDPRYILWRGGSRFNEGSDCCDLHVRDRSTGSDLDVPGSLIPEWVDWEGDWLGTAGFATNDPQRPTETFTNIVTGESFWIDGWWGLEAQLDETHLLLSEVGEENRTSVLDTRTRELQPLDFPEPLWDEPTYADGVVALDRPADSDVGALVLLPFDGGAIEVLANDVHEHFVRTQAGDVVYLHRDSDEAPAGTLMHVARDGASHEVATDVLGFEIPFHGTDREREEILFAVGGPERGGLWRYVLP